MSNNDKKNRSSFFKTLFHRDDKPESTFETTTKDEEKRVGFLQGLKLKPRDLAAEHEEKLAEYDKIHEEMEQLAIKMQLEANKSELKKLEIKVDTSLPLEEQLKRAKKEFVKHPSNNTPIMKALYGSKDTGASYWEYNFMQYVQSGIMTELDAIKSGKEVPLEKKKMHEDVGKLVELLIKESESIGSILGLRHSALKKHPEDEKTLKGIEEIESLISRQDEFSKSLSKVARDSESEKKDEDRAADALFGRINSVTVQTFNEEQKRYSDIIKSGRVKLPDVDSCLKEFIKPSPFAASMEDIMEVIEEGKRVKDGQKTDRTDIVSKGNNDLITK